MATVKKTAPNTFNVHSTTREVWGVDDPPESGPHEADCQCPACGQKMYLNPIVDDPTFNLDSYRLSNAGATR